MPAPSFGPGESDGPGRRNSSVATGSLDSEGMDTPFAERCTALADAWRWWATTLPTLDDESWRRPTRLPGWSVAALVAHHGFLVGGLAFLASQPVDREPGVRTAVDMLRGFNAPDGAAHTA